MAYVVPIHKPTSVRHAVKLRLLDPGEDCLVVVKANNLHMYRQNGTTLALEHTKSIYGKVTMLEKFRPASSRTDHLFVGTDRYAYFTLSWDASKRQWITERTFVDAADNGAKDSQSGSRCLVDPSGQIMVLDLFEGIVTVLPIIQKVDRAGKKKGYELGNLGDPAPARIPELYVKSAAFLHGASSPTLALLWEDGHGKVHLRAKEVSYTDGSSSEPAVAELTDTSMVIPNVPDQGASHIIPVPAPVGGLLILGESTVTYVDGKSNEITSTNLDEPTIFATWEQLDHTRFLLADDYGKLFLLELDVDEGAYASCSLKILGETSKASVIVALNSSHVFVGSHQGDSQVISLDFEAATLEVDQTIPNIAPILDFTLMDMGSQAGEGQINEYSSGQARIVTGSGAFQNGSLRSVRSGVGLEDQGILGEMEGITDLFSLRSSSLERQADTLVASFVNETRVFRFSSDGEVEESEAFNGLSLSENTLLAASVLTDQIIQVTPTSVRLLDAESGTVVSEWTPSAGQHITDASANEEKVVVAVGGVSLVALDIRSQLAVVVQKTFGSTSQIACVTVPPSPSTACVVGFWQSAAISVLGLDTFEELHVEDLGDGDRVSVPRTLLLAQVLPDHPPTLFVAMADGIVFTFLVNTDDYSLSGKKSMVLGTQQAGFSAIPRGDGLSNVFATCEHPSLIYGEEGRLVYAAVTADEATCVCPFDAQAFPGSIAIATASDLKISLVDVERRTHVKDLELNQTVRRVAYSAKLRAFGLGTVKRTLQDGAEIVKSHVKLVDEVHFELLDTYALNDEEIVESVIRAELGDGADGPSERFVVGTGYLEDERGDSVRGRILVFEVNEERKLKVVAELGVKGACRCLSILDGKIVAALIKTVVIYAFDEGSTTPSLVRLASYRTATAPIDMAITGNIIAVADLMKSVSIVEYRRGEGSVPHKLQEVARHFQTAWGTAVAHVAKDTFLESDAEGNLMVLHQNNNGVTEDDRRRLETTSEMRLGEVVNRIRSINMPVSADAAVIPRAFLATVEGSIYLFALIAPRKQDLLMRLQASLAKVIDSPGHMSFNSYRAFKNTVRETDEPFRFVDGELIERFLDCSELMQEDLVEGLEASAEDVRGMVEGLKRLH
ncbi:MAG: hypothetical protein M1832_005336 [Thelocarpon impressellum]|nr:MAG: hypothetical protein M1832_005336 [Thelocarpon impressellum]